MPVTAATQFSFVSRALSERTFSVVRFRGAEGISRLYEYDITVSADDPEIDLGQVLQNPATLTLHGRDGDVPVHGILARFEQLQELDGRFLYQAVLVPRLWQADLYRENQLFLEKTVPDIVEEILKQAGLSGDDYELKLKQSYPQWEYICQYDETDLGFVSRWMEREGIYYFFEQGDRAEKLIVTDSSDAHEAITGRSRLDYVPPTGMASEKEAIETLVCQQHRLPHRVVLQDYNYRKPSLDLKAEAVVDQSGRGDVFSYGEHFKTPDEGRGLAGIRAEEIRCRETVFHGEGTAPAVSSGFTFELGRHYRDSYNQGYLIVEVQHQGGSSRDLAGDATGPEPGAEPPPAYANSFTAIPSDVQFRPERRTPRTRFFGTLNARIDAAGVGDYAEIDDQGRYKVRLPFDASGSEDGKASRWVRMAQPYAGADHGMHFPLHKGTEVLLTFVGGDPDRPIIAGAVPNAETQSVTTNENFTQNAIRSAGGNVLQMDDMLGQERVLLKSPRENSWMRLGTPNDPDYVEDKNEGVGIAIGTRANLALRSGKNMKVKFRQTLTETHTKPGGDPGNYSRTVESTGQVTEAVGGDKYTRQVDAVGNVTETSGGDVTETIAGNLTEDVTGTVKIESDGRMDLGAHGADSPLKIHSSGRMDLKTDNKPIKIDSGSANVQIDCNCRVENTQSETETMNWGMKTEIAGGHINEICYGFKFESLDALSIALGLAGVIDINPLFKIETTGLNLVNKGIALKNEKTEFKNAGIGLKMVKILDFIG